MSLQAEAGRWQPYIDRYRGGAGLDRTFCDLILDDARRLPPGFVAMDIGCGHGIAGNAQMQGSIAALAGRYIGIEPDPEIPLGGYFTEAHRCLLERAPIAPASVDLAFSVLVMEHLPHPETFWAKLAEVLVEGGVYWGFTIDARHIFSKASMLTERLKIKDLYLTAHFGRRGVGRIENYPTFYRTNTPARVAELSKAFRSCECINMSMVGQWGNYLPRPLRPLADSLDRRDIRLGRPGTILAIRAVR